MKTAVSIPDEVFRKAERLARRSRKSRSALYSAALREYVARHTPDEITDAMNAVCEKLKEDQTEFVSRAARRVLSRIRW